MNIHQLIKDGIPLASDEGTDTLVVLDDESGDLIAYVGHEGDYNEEARQSLDEDEELDLNDLIGAAEDFLDDVVDGGEGGNEEGEEA